MYDGARLVDELGLEVGMMVDGSPSDKDRAIKGRRINYFPALIQCPTGARTVIALIVRPLSVSLALAAALF